MGPCISFFFGQLWAEAQSCFNPRVATLDQIWQPPGRHCVQLWWYTAAILLPAQPEGCDWLSTVTAAADAAAGHKFFFYISLCGGLGPRWSSSFHGHKPRLARWRGPMVVPLIPQHRR
ncbi:hypothetical protein L484_007703 [Morus notabilis]|uniref:Uncharacterized protein n=1 Tax=Morus notabilis TaxID=981085 RepID=W9RXK4_9ROSA|nr:hypothetical protein L484_007703 [Morus notabilis]